MAKVKYDVKGVEAGAVDFIEAPVGLYVAEIVEAVTENPKDKDRRVHVQLEIRGAGRENEPIEYENKGEQYGRLHDYVNLVSEAARFKLKQYLIATDVVDEDKSSTETGTTDPDKDWPGTLVLVRVRHEPYGGETRAKPGSIMPFEGEAAADPDDEDDDGKDTGDDDAGDAGDDDGDDELWTEEELAALSDKELAEEAFTAEDDEENPGFGLDKAEFTEKKGRKTVLKRDEVIAAILEAQDEDGDGDADDDDDAGDAGDDDEPPYEDMDLEDLIKELKERELEVPAAKKGRRKVSDETRKKQAIELLEKDDEEDPF